MLHTLIMGTGVTGASCARYLHGRDRLTVIDTRDAPPGLASIEVLEDIALHLGVTRFDFAGIDRVIVSPGLAMDSCLVKAAQQAGVPLMSDIDLFFEAVNAPVWCVTGTNGKSTVTCMAAELLTASGRHAVACGNLGAAALDALADDVDSYVVELSSFQLERLGAHAKQGAVLLNVSDDHLDRHGDLQSYAAAKQRVFDDCAYRVCARDDAFTHPAAGAQATFGLGVGDGPDDWGTTRLDGETWFCRGDEQLLRASDLHLPGEHNQLNFLAANALVSPLGVDQQAMRHVAQHFSGLPHRCQLVRTIAGVRYINDSKATNVGATVAAVNGLVSQLESSARIVLIAGGDGKGADFTPLGAVAARLRGTVLIGKDADHIEQVLPGAGRESNLEDAVVRAAQIARAGDIVLLSPACASLDMFTSYAARGDAFAEAVEALGS